METNAAICILLGTCPSLLLAVALARSFYLGNRLDTAIFATTIVHETLLVGWPAVWSAVSGFEHEQAMLVPVTTGDIAEVLLGETLFTLVLLSGFYLARGRCSRLTSPVEFQLPIRHPLTRILIIVGCANYSLALFFPALGGGIEGNLPFSGPLLSVYGWMQSLFWLPSLIAAALVLSQPRAFRLNPRWWLLSLVVLSCVILTGFTTGLRGRFIWVASLLAIGAYLQSNRIAGRLAGFGLLLALPLFPFFGSTYRAIYQTSLAEGSGTLDVLRTMAEGGAEALRAEGGANTLFALGESLGERGMATRNSTILYHERESITGLDLRTWVGSLAFPIPRALFSDKPMPGSPSASALDAPIYRVMEIGHGYDGYMGPVLASALAFREGGWIWVAFTGFAIGTFWGLMLRRTTRASWQSMIAVTFAGSLLIDGFFTMMQPAYALLLQTWKCLFLLLMIGMGTAAYRALLPTTRIEQNSRPKRITGAENTV